MGSEAGVVGESTERGEAEPPPAELLVNLTEHDVVLASRQVREGTDAQASVCIPPDGRYARVDDGAARQRDYLLDTTSGVVRVTRLSRSRRLVDLPPPRPRTRYVVSRVTALAARDRADLVFPFGEIRDEAGRVAGARGLASFQPRVAVWRRLGERRAPARDRRRGQPLSRQWLTGVLFAVATALLSATLSLVPGVLDSARANGWGAAWATWTLRLTAGFAVAGLVVLVVAARRWHESGVMLEERGTAYVIEEEAIAGWIIRQASGQAARVVPLATRFPQELAVGLGMQLGQRSSEREPGKQLPQRVYPVFYTGDTLVPDAGRLVVPDLRLGAGPVPSYRG
jgi:hypothetical protein